MTSDICGEDVVVRFTPAQMSSVGGVAGGGAGGVAGGGVVEMGRRLLAAAREGDAAGVRGLMAMGAPFTTDWLGTSPLHVAALHGHTDTCRVLLRAGISRDTRTKTERTALHLAAYAGHAAVAALLLEAGAAADCRDMLAMTPLHWAVERGHTPVAAELARRGADVRAVSKFLKTPLGIARERNDPVMLQLLQDADVPRPEKAKAEETNSFEVDSNVCSVEVDETEAGDEAREAWGERPPATEGAQGAGGVGGGESGEGAVAAAALLRSHGITLLPADDGSTVLSALQSGRTIVLSDAGKLMLKESEEVRVATPAAPPTAPAPATAPTQPKHLKIVALNKKLVALPTVTTANSSNLQVKYVQMGGGGVRGGVGARAVVGRGAAGAKGAGKGSTVKILVNRAQLGRLVGGAGAGMDNVVRVPEQFLRSDDAEYLRGHLLAAHTAIARLTRELRAARAAAPRPPDLP